MAGVTREARAALERLPDRISIGVLGSVFTRDLVEEVIDAADVREVRYRRLPAHLMVIFVLSCWLFMRSGYGLVMSKLADAHAVGGRGWGDWDMPTTGSITKARVRLGAEPLKLLFDRVKGPSGSAATPGVFHRDLRVVSIDGFTLDLPDTEANDEEFGRGATAAGMPGPYPQLRAVALAEAGTRSLLGAAYGGYRDGEQTLAASPDILGALGPDMLLLADRNFPSWRLWREVAATGADLLWRMSASFTLPVLQVLPDGTYLSELRPPRKKDGPPIPVRVIEYSVLTDNDQGEQVSELFVLATTLLDPTHAPAADLAALYHDRWQAETGIGEIKTEQRGGPEVVLRSKTPTMVAQEFWAMLCVYQATRHLISRAAPPGLDPSRISFKRAITAARDSATQAALSPHGT
ncbi:MAG: IS4 family transposase [Actinobacteria bacterium]|nr:IS4 family transposase [Actinomycetota bacterium]